MKSIAEDIQTIGRLPAVPTILEVMVRTTGLRFTAVARVTDEKWTALAVHDLIDFGLKPGDELELESTICNEIRQHGQSVFISHVAEHPHFCTHPTPKQYGFESYLSIPIRLADGSFFGTLCAIDPKPANLDDQNLIRSVTLFADLIAAQIDLDHRLHVATETAKLREQFVAVLGHDLRDPLNTVSMAVEVLERQLREPQNQRMTQVIKQSTRRMSHLISDLLDFARGRLGGGMPVQRRASTTLAETLRHIVAEVQVAHPDRAITADIALVQPVQCDNERLAQLLGNLLNNAVKHGDPRQPVTVQATQDAAGFTLTVENGGTLPEAVQANLFEPFVRGGQARRDGGLGLGLYIAAEIAKAHQGTLDAASENDRTRFRLFIPAGV